MIRAARGGGGLSMALTHLVISQFLLLPHSFLFSDCFAVRKEGMDMTPG